MDNFPTITVCGSMRYYAKMLAVAAEFTSNGFIVLMPFCSEDEETDNKYMLDEMHLAKIDRSEYIVVVGKHRGESTRREVQYAKDNGKRIYER